MTSCLWRCRHKPTTKKEKKKLKNYNLTELHSFFLKRKIHSIILVVSDDTRILAKQELPIIWKCDMWRVSKGIFFVVFHQNLRFFFVRQRWRELVSSVQCKHLFRNQKKCYHHPHNIGLSLSHTHTHTPFPFTIRVCFNRQEILYSFFFCMIK